jgi:hypothetical protein
MRISLIEQMVYRYPAGMEKFRLFRIEYGGHASACLSEGIIWLPATMNPDRIEKVLERGAKGI